MPTQAMVGIGLIVKTLEDIPEIYRERVRVALSHAADEYEEIMIDVELTLLRQNAAGKEVKHHVKLILVNDQEEYLFLNSEHGTFFGTFLNSRYSPGFLDCDHPYGNGELLSIDHLEIAQHIMAVRSVLPGADLVIFTRHF